MDKIDIHPQIGVPIVFHDQLNMIGKHLAEIRQHFEEQNKKHQLFLGNILPKVTLVKFTKKKRKVTRKILKQHQDWNDRPSSEHEQLDQYEKEGIFSQLTVIPKDANCLSFIWT